MKTAFYFTFFLMSTLSPLAFASANLQKLAGSYVSDDGARFVVSVSNNSVTLRTNAELSRYKLCRAPLSLVSKNTSSNQGFAEAIFDVSHGQCSRMDGPVTLHYNRAITGVDVYLIDVVIRPARVRDSGLKMRWHLTKIRN